MKTPRELDTPVVFIIFRRPETTRQVFARIAEACPSQLFIIADGPKTPDQRSLCEEARSIVADITWHCNVVRDYSDINLGLRNRILSGLGHVFSQVERAIILEDDCLPDLSFFDFASVLLRKYSDEPRIAHISGDNFLRHSSFTNDYYFSRYAHVWGWATWRRAWEGFDSQLGALRDKDVRSGFLKRFDSPDEYRFWEYTLQQLDAGQINTWDYPWAISLMLQDKLAINPTVNLVQNIGFNADATHTTASDADLSRPASSVTLRLDRPHSFVPDNIADAEVARLFFSTVPPSQSVGSKISRRIKRLLRNA